MLQMTAVFALPPKAGCRILVNLLSRYGTWPLYIRCSLSEYKCVVEYGQLTLFLNFLLSASNSLKAEKGFSVPSNSHNSGW